MSQHPPRRRQSGSAYIVALMVLVVLTILGLGLALITQTELQIGANELTEQRIFYSADSGIGRAAAQTLTKFECDSRTFTLADLDPNTGNATAFGAEQSIDVSPVVPLVPAWCSLCSVHNATQANIKGSDEYFNMNFVVTSQATRQVGAVNRELGRRTISAFFSLQPFEHLCEESFKSPDIAKIKM